MRRHIQNSPQGFTLIELLVVLAIIAVLIGLILPSVQKVREAANRMRCANHLRQIGHAVHNFHDTHSAFPPDRIRNEWATWAVFILPYLEQGNIYKQWNLQMRYWDQSDAARKNNLSVYFCPSRRSAGGVGFSTGESDRLNRYTADYPGGLSDYASCGGNDNATGAMMVATARGVTPQGQVVVANGIEGTFNRTPAGTRILSWQSQTNMASITDGTTNTILVGEKFVQKRNLNGRMEDRSVFNSANPGPYRRLLGDRGSMTYTIVSDVNSDAQSWPGCNFSFGSAHPTVCQFVMVDGAVKAFRSSLSKDVLQNLGQRSDGKVVQIDD